VSEKGDTTKMRWHIAILNHFNRKHMGKPSKTINFGGTESFRQTPFATETHPVTSSPRTAAAAEAIDRTKRLPRQKKMPWPQRI